MSCHGDQELTRFHHPLLQAPRPKRKCSLVEVKAHLAGLARLEVYLDKSLQLPEGSRDRRLHVSDIDLNDLCASPLSGVSDRCRHSCSKIAAGH